MPLYVYGLVPAGRGLACDVRGVSGGEVRWLDIGPVSALVTLVDEEPAIDVDGLAAHASVVETAFAAGTVLPFRAGTVVDAETLLAEVARNIAGYEAQLEHLAGRCELEVTARYEEEPVLRLVLSECREIRELARATGPDSDVGAQLHLGELVGAHLERWLGAAGFLIDRRLRGLAAAVIPGRVSGNEVFRAACLVATAAVRDIVAEMLAANQEMPWLSLDVAGPVAPYSFVEPLA